MSTSQVAFIEHFATDERRAILRALQSKTTEQLTEVLTWPGMKLEDALARLSNPYALVIHSGDETDPSIIRTIQNLAEFTPVQRLFHYENDQIHPMDVQQFNALAARAAS